MSSHVSMCKTSALGKILSSYYVLLLYVQGLWNENIDKLLLQCLVIAWLCCKCFLVSVYHPPK